MALNFHQLHIFHTVAEKGNFSTAAQALHMTQPAVTMQVQALEDYFGIKLFHRSTKKVELTEAGKVLLPYALKGMNIVRDAEDSMTKFTKHLKGQLQLGASLTFGEYIFPRIIAPFAKKYPDMSVRMKVMNTSQITEEILNHQLSFGIVEAAIHHPDFHTEPVLSDELMLILPKNHPLTKLEAIQISDIVQYPFVLREQGSGTRIVMEEVLEGNGFDPQRLNIVMELGSTGSIKSAVEAGLGISIISKSSVKHELSLGLLEARKIEGIQFIRDFYSIYLKSTILPMTAVAFITFLRDLDMSSLR